jgi:2-oxoglutarate ferredoxin oxidoreductase subunit delta
MIATTRDAAQNSARDDLALPGAEPPALAGPAPGPAPWTPLLIAIEYCKGCSLCIGACEKHALALDEHRVNAMGYHPIRLADAAACTSCALCARVCPDCVLTVLAPPRPARPAKLEPAKPEGVAR